MDAANRRRVVCIDRRIFRSVSDIEAADLSILIRPAMRRRESTPHIRSCKISTSTWPNATMLFEFEMSGNEAFRLQKRQRNAFTFSSHMRLHDCHGGQQRIRPTAISIANSQRASRSCTISIWEARRRPSWAPLGDACVEIVALIPRPAPRAAGSRIAGFSRRKRPRDQGIAGACDLGVDRVCRSDCAGHDDHG